MVGLASTPQQFFIFYLISFLVSFAGNSLGLLIGSLSSDPKQVSAIIPVLLVPFILFSGFFKNRNNLPVWLGWMEYISPIKYSFSAFTINQITQNNAVLTTLGFDFDMWPAIGMLIALTVFYRVFSLFFLWLLRTKLE